MQNILEGERAEQNPDAGRLQDCYGPDCTILSHQNNKHDSAYAQAHGAITQNTDAD